MTAIDRFNDEDLDMLAEALYLGEAIPPHLEALWQHAGNDLETLARIEERRDWIEQLAAGLEDAPRDTTALISVSRGRTGIPGRGQKSLVARLVHCTGRLRPELRLGLRMGQPEFTPPLGAEPVVMASRTAESFDAGPNVKVGDCVKFVGVEVRVAEKENGTIRVEIGSAQAPGLPSSFVEVEVLREGERIAVGVTNAEGVVFLEVPSDGDFELNLDWPDSFVEDPPDRL
jgi:hypothetical protein